MIRAITTVCFVGLLRPAPGTWGSAVALPLCWAVHVLTGFPGVVIATLLITALGLWAIGQQADGETDPPEIVIDEVAGQFIALWPVSAGIAISGAAPLALWPGWIAAFLAFRLFDIWKPGPIRRAEQLPGAKGVMADDLVAGVAAAIVVTAAAALFHLVLI